MVGCLGVVSGQLEGYFKKLGIPNVLGCMQASAVIVTTLILQETLDLQGSGPRLGRIHSCGVNANFSFVGLV